MSNVLAVAMLGCGAAPAAPAVPGAIAPALPVRMEYVVDPVTIGHEKRSVGVDELAAVTLR